jgi:hypothetical protein
MALGLGVSMLFGASGAYGYQETSVVDGGMLTGTVQLKGGKPAARAFNLVTYADHIYCGRISDGSGWRLLQDFTIGEGGGVKDVVVMLMGVTHGKLFAFAEPRSEAINCQLKPYVIIVRDQSKVEVVNMDPVLHDIQAYETSELGPRLLFEVSLPASPDHPPTARLDAEYHTLIPGELMTKTIHMTKGKGRRVFVMQCGIHEFMESWGLAVDNPYYALTDQSGRFEIDDIPPGNYKLVVWHPKARAVIERDVTIPAKGAVSATFEIQQRGSPRVRGDTVEHSRYNLGNPKLQEIKPTLELQRESD